MWTVIIAALILLAMVLGMRSYIKQKGSCGDCHVDCAIKQEIRRSEKNHHYPS